jgi:hypothetical protein
MKKYFKVSGFAAAGALLGFAYYYFIGCTNSGGCPLTSHWYVTTVYGLVTGVIAAFPFNNRI